MQWTDKAHFYLHRQVSNQNLLQRKPTGLYHVISSFTQDHGMVWFYGLPPFSLSLNCNCSFIPGNAPILFDGHRKIHSPAKRRSAPKHITNPVKVFLNETFGDQVISRHFPRKWPARSPDLNPIDYWLCRQLKHIIYSKQQKTLEDLRDSIDREVSDIDVIVMKSAVMNLFDRLFDHSARWRSC